MAIRMPWIMHAKQVLRQSSLAAANKAASSTAGAAADVPKGHLAVYVGESKMKRFVIPISYLSNPSFQDLLSQAEEEFGFDHPMGGLSLNVLLFHVEKTFSLALLLNWVDYDSLQEDTC